MGRDIIFQPNNSPDWLDKLILDDIIVAHIFHSLLHLRDKQGLLVYKEGMTPTQLHLANYTWLSQMKDQFEAKRSYKVGTDAITEALYWFIMGYKKKT